MTASETKHKKQTAAQRYKETDLRDHYGLFGDLTEKIDLGDFYPWGSKLEHDIWKYTNRLAVKNIGCGC